MVKAGAEVNAADHCGWTPLYEVSSEGHKDIVALLLKAGADVNTADNDGWTALSEACLGRHKDIAALLLKAGADVNTVNNAGNSPLFEACSEENKYAAVFLSKHGAHFLDKRVIDKLSGKSKVFAEKSNHVISKRTALLCTLLNDSRENHFLKGTELPEVLQALIIKDMLGHRIFNVKQHVSSTSKCIIL